MKEKMSVRKTVFNTLGTMPPKNVGAAGVGIECVSEWHRTAASSSGGNTVGVHRRRGSFVMLHAQQQRFVRPPCVSVCVCVCSRVCESGSVRFFFFSFLFRKRRVYPEAALCIVPSSKRSIAQCVSQTRHLHSQNQCRQHTTQISHFSKKKIQPNEIEIPRLVFVFLIFIYFISLVRIWPCEFRQKNPAQTKKKN